MAAAITGNKPHVLAIPIPAQGHVNPLMILCRQIAKHGVKVTFVNAQSIHDKIVSAAAKKSGEDEKEEEEEEEHNHNHNHNHNIVLATVPDGLTPDDDPSNPFKLIESLRKTMPQSLTDLIERINSSNPNEKISCVIADFSFGWVFDIAEKMGAEPVGFSPPSLACLAILHHTLKLLDEGDADTNDSLRKGDVISLSDDIPPWRRDEFPWCFSGDPVMEKLGFDLVNLYRDAHKAKWSLCNSCYELEPAASELLPKILPVGPLHLLDSDSDAVGSCSVPNSFYSEDASCVSWLHNKPDGSVIYVSFGSLAVFSQQQLDELAFGLELSGRAFLWVTRPNLANGSRAVYPDGFLERVGELGKVVEWAPQDRVLSHPSIGCFVSHCGWNSTLEGVSRGVPFLCWSYSADQLHNERYICDKWKIGLRITPDKGRIQSRHEIKRKIDMVFSDNNFKENALKLKEMCVRSVNEGGFSYKNLEKFIDHLWK